MSSDAPLTIALKKDWDHPQHYLRQEGHFVGRRKELGFLIDNMIRRNNGSILISGSRGVGKTALVYKAMATVAEKVQKTIFAVLNVSELEIELGKNAKDSSSSLQIRLVVIQNLIRRLFTASMSDARLTERSGLAALYMKAAAKETSLQHLLEAEAAGRAETSRTTIKTLRTPLSVGSIPVAVLFGYLLSIHPVWPLGEGLYGLLNQVLPLLVASIGPLTFVLAYEKKEEKSSQARQRLKASQFYEFDGGLASLQFDLENCLNEFRMNGHKVIFCIDELDKVGNPELVIDIVTSFKNLFNLGSAIFIVITGPSEYDVIEKAKGDRGVYYTLFTNRIFVPRPSFSDLEGFIDEIADIPPAVTLRENQRYNEFRNYLCYLAKSDFFDLYALIRDFVVGYDKEGRPLMKVPELSQDELTEARVQKSLGQIFERYQKAELSKWPYNEALLSDLYAFTSNLLSQPDNYSFADEFPGIPADFRQARVDFCIYLARVEALTPKGKDPKGYNVYAWTGRCPVVPTGTDSLLSYEEEFVNKYDQLVDGILSFTNAYQTGLGHPPFSRDDFDVDRGKVLEITSKAVEADFRATFDSQTPYYMDLQSEFPRAYPRDVLLGFSSALGEQSKILSDLGRRFILFRSIARDSIKDATVTNLQADAALFATVEEIRKAVIEGNIPHVVITKPDRSKQILVTQNLPASVVTGNRDFLKQNRRILQLVNIQTDPTLAYRNVPGFKNLNLVGQIERAPIFVQGLAKWLQN